MFLIHLTKNNFIHFIIFIEHYVQPYMICKLAGANMLSKRTDYYAMPRGGKTQIPISVIYTLLMCFNLRG